MIFYECPHSSLLQNKANQVRLCLREVTKPFKRMASKMMWQMFLLIFLGFFQNSILIENEIEIEPRFGNLSDVLAFKISGGQDSSNVPMTVSTLKFQYTFICHAHYIFWCLRFSFCFSFCSHGFLYVEFRFARLALQNMYFEKSKPTEDD